MPETSPAKIHAAMNSSRYRMGAPAALRKSRGLNRRSRTNSPPPGMLFNSRSIPMSSRNRLAAAAMLHVQERAHFPRLFPVQAFFHQDQVVRNEH